MFGWTWEYIDEYVTVPRLQEIAAYWAKVPPLHEAFALFIGAREKGDVVTSVPPGTPDRPHGAPGHDDAEFARAMFGVGIAIPASVLANETSG
ncbi:MAG: hypothetical protein ACHQWU_13405 [Gemmatimonadales bacterium]